MSSQLPLEPQALDQFLVNVRESVPHEDIHGNPFFYLVKPTKENLLKYQFNRPESKIFLVLNLLNFLPLVLFHISESIAISIYSFGKARPIIVQDKDEFKYLFLSHFTYAQNPNKEDIFFGKNLDSKDSFALYLNHTRLNAAQIFESFQNVGKTKVAINLKSLKPFSMLKLQFTQTRISFWLLRKAIKDEGLKVGQKRALIKGAVFQHKRSTMANLVLREILSEVILKVKPRNLVLTLEGHAHERLILEMRSNFFTDIKIIGYQHAPIVPSQYNLFRTVASLRSNDTFLTSGEDTKQLALSKSLKCKVKVLGSLKAREYKFQLKDSSQLQVLVAPEGTKESLMEFIFLINELVPLLPNVNFVLRVHPALGDLANKIIKKNLLVNDQISISSSSLAEDLKRSHAVLFRSSAIGIEGLSFGAFPIHINQKGDNSLNPIVSNRIDFLNLKSTSDIVKCLSNFESKLSQNEEFQKKCFEVFNGYFGTLKNINSLVH